jgi:hypothetical protein
VAAVYSTRIADAAARRVRPHVARSSTSERRFLSAPRCVPRTAGPF